MTDAADPPAPREPILLRRRRLPGIVLALGLAMLLPELAVWASAALDAAGRSLPGLDRWALIDRFGLIPAKVLGHADFLQVPLAFWQPGCFGDPVPPEWTAMCGAQREVWAARAVGGAEPWRLASHAFLHGGPVHLVLNGLAFLAFAPRVARRMGAMWFAGFFLACAAAGGLAFMAGGYGLDIWRLQAGLLGDRSDLPMLTGQVPLVGASGAIFGVIMADLMLRWQRARRQPPGVALAPPGVLVRQMLVLGLGVNLAFELLPTGISGAAHIGGAAAGLALLPLTRRRTTRRHRTGRITRTP